LPGVGGGHRYPVLMGTLYRTSRHWCMMLSVNTAHR
jgi:hypothetical protein